MLCLVTFINLCFESCKLLLVHLALLAQTGRMQDWGWREKMPVHAGVPKAKASGTWQTGPKV